MGYAHGGLRSKDAMGGKCTCALVVLRCSKVVVSGGVRSSCLVGRHIEQGGMSSVGRGGRVLGVCGNDGGV